MNFKKLPPEKRKQLILVVLVTLVLLGGLGWGVIRSQYLGLAQVAVKKVSVQNQLRQAQETIKRSAQVETDLQVARAAMTEAESDVATGDLYSWVINTFRRFKAPYKVQIPQFSPLGAPTETTLLPAFPYKQAVLVMSGTARFHDFGRYLADLENQFPHMRVINLSLDLNSSPAAGEEETLSFRMEIIMLVKPNAS